LQRSGKTSRERKKRHVRVGKRQEHEDSAACPASRLQEAARPQLPGALGL